MSDHQTIDSHAVPSYQCPKQSLLNQLYIRNIDQVQVQDIPLISRVFGPYCKLRTEFFPSIYGPSAKRAGHKSMEKNEYP